MNVALTRCRKGMVVVTDKSFLQGAGRAILLGQLSHTWSRRHDTYWIDWIAMLNNAVALPGLPLPRPPASFTSQQPPAMTRIDEQSHPIPIHSLSLSSGWGTRVLPLDPPSMPQTQTRQTRTMHQASLSALAPWPAPSSASVIEPRRRSATVTTTEPVRPSARNAWGPSSSGGIPTAGMAVPRELEDAFPPLPSATPLYQSSRHRSPKVQ